MKSGGQDARSVNKHVISKQLTTTLKQQHVNSTSPVESPAVYGRICARTFALSEYLLNTVSQLLDVAPSVNRYLYEGTRLGHRLKCALRAAIELAEVHIHSDAVLFDVECLSATHNDVRVHVPEAQKMAWLARSCSVPGRSACS